MYNLGVDTWEGQLEIDENILLSEGVKYIITRMNDISGGLHMDTNFQNQWEQSRRFLRAPYYVYNPWVDGKINAQFLLDHAPKETTRIFADIEVAYTGITPAKYAYDVQIFVDLAKKVYPKLSIYTGPWFKGYLTSWPTNVDYWWARYPFYVYPAAKTVVSWPYITERVNQLSWTPDAGTKAPGTVVLWQCSAERFIMPGCSDRPIDINISNLSLDNLSAWWGQTIQPVPKTIEERVIILEREAVARGWNLS